MSSGRRYSLRSRLMVLLIGAMSVLWLGAGVAAFLHALEETDDLLDAQMVQASELVLGLVRGSEVERPVGSPREQVHPYRMPVFYQVMDLYQGHWRMLAHTPEAANESLPVERLNEGFSRVDIAGKPWRVFVRIEQGADRRLFRVVVGQLYGIRDGLAHEFAEHLLVPLALGFPLMALAIWGAVHRATGPVGEAAAKVTRMPVSQLGPIALTEPLPVEIAPLVDAIDSLTARVARAIDNERRFTADAAHELRTPLAALRVQAQAALRVNDPEERRRVLRQVLAGVERMTHLVEQLLALARLDPAAATASERQATDLSDIAAETCAELAPRAIARGQEVQLRTGALAPVGIDPSWAAALVRNLVDNALRYGRDGGNVEVEVRRDGGDVTLTVRDDGPGVAPEVRPRLAERFYRAGGDSGVDGCGLGLSIVARIAESSRARIEYADGLPAPGGGVGLAVRVVFPAA